MILVLIVAAVLVIAGLAVIGYRIGPAPGGRAITERDRRLQTERSDQAAFRGKANPNLRSDCPEVVESLATAAVLAARTSVDVRPSLNETEALAEAVGHLDQLEREATGVSLGPLIPEIAVHLVSVGVLDRFNPGNPELIALTLEDFAANPGLVIRIIGVSDLDAWPQEV